MRCHYCDTEAAYAADSEGVRVGLCERHLQQFVRRYAEADLADVIENVQD